MLPSPHVNWDDLPDEGQTQQIAIEGAPRPVRWWRPRLTIGGVPVAQAVRVFKGRQPDFAVLGIEDVGRAFRIALHWYAVPPVFELEPAVPILDTSGVAPPDRLEHGPVALYEDQAFGLHGGQPWRTAAGVPDPATIEAVAQSPGGVELWQARHDALASAPLDVTPADIVARLPEPTPAALLHPTIRPNRRKARAARRRR